MNRNMRTGTLFGGIAVGAVISAVLTYVYWANKPDYKAELASVKSQYGKLIASNSKLKTRVSELSTHNEKLIGRNRRAQSRNAVYLSQINEYKADADKAQLEISRLTARIFELQGHDSGAGRLERENRRLRRRMVRVEAARDRKQELAVERLRKNEQLTGQLSKATDEISAARRQAAQLESELENQTADLQKQRAEVARLRGLLDAGKTQQSGATVDVDRLKRRIKFLSDQRELFRKLSANHARDLNAAKVSFAGIEDDLQQCRSRATQCEAKLEQARVRPAARSKSAVACQNALKQVATNGEIRFAPASIRLRRSSFGTLRKLASAMKNCDGLSITVEGHTDSSGPESANRVLSKERAAVVRDFLVRRGVDASRLEAIGFGSSKPIGDNRRPEGRRANRRIEFSVR